VSVAANFKALMTLGPATAARRIYHALRLKSGFLKWLDASGPFGPEDLSPHLTHEKTLATLFQTRRDGDIPFFFQARKLDALIPDLKACVPPDATAEIPGQINNLEAGRLPFFSRWSAELGDPIGWRRNPVTDGVWPIDPHWSRCPHFNAKLGDIKFVWEASRFAQCYLLTRASVLTREDQPLRLALRRIEEWIDANPPACGPQWACGQETAFRLMAWCFALNAAYGCDLLTESLFGKIAASIYRQALRIEHHIGFACSIRNNHSISEAVGLYTVGLLFPEFDRAERWRKLGRRVLIADTCKLVFDDGAFIQHSMNYHRLMLHDCIWAVRLGRLHGESFPAEFMDRIAKASDFIYQMHDSATGRVPNYGANDGALVLPLTSCDYLDYRPVIQSSHYLVHGKRILDEGPWDEELLWLFGPEALEAPITNRPLESRQFDTGGYYTLRGEESWAMIRCHTYKERPAQADMLHFDLWWRGENILRDAGSYSYYCPGPWNAYFNGTAAHNTITVDGRNQLTRGPRFMWFDWTRSRFRHHERSDDGRTECWEGEHDGYRKRSGVTHRRRVERHSDGSWTVTDDLLGSGNHIAALYWHLGDWRYEWDEERSLIKCRTPVGKVWLRVSTEGCETSQNADRSRLRQRSSGAGMGVALLWRKTGDGCLRMRGNRPLSDAARDTNRSGQTTTCITIRNLFFARKTWMLIK